MVEMRRGGAEGGPWIRRTKVLTVCWWGPPPQEAIKWNRTGAGQQGAWKKIKNMTELVAEVEKGGNYTRRG